MVDEDWGRLEKPPAFAARYPSSMHFCFGHIIAQLDQWCRIEAPGELVAPVFDEDMEPKAANAIFEEYKANPRNPNLIASLTWGNDKRHPMIQAADLVVGELREFWFDRVYPVIGGPEFSFPIEMRAALSGKAFSDSGLWDLRSLQVAVRDFVETGDPFGEPDVGTRTVQDGRRIRPEEA